MFQELSCQNIFYISVDVETVTCVHEAPRRSFTELFGLIGQRDLDDPGDVTGRGLHPDCMGGDQLERHRGRERETDRRSGLYSVRKDNDCTQKDSQDRLH